MYQNVFYNIQHGTALCSCLHLWKLIRRRNLNMMLMYNLALKPTEPATSLQLVLPCSCLLWYLLSTGCWHFGDCWFAFLLHRVSVEYTSHSLSNLQAGDEPSPWSSTPSSWCISYPSALHSLTNATAPFKTSPQTSSWVKESSLVHVVKALWRERFQWKIPSVGKGGSYLHPGNFQQNLLFLLCSKSSVKMIICTNIENFQILEHIIIFATYKAFLVFKVLHKDQLMNPQVIPLRLSDVLKVKAWISLRARIRYEQIFASAFLT